MQKPDDAMSLRARYSIESNRLRIAHAGISCTGSSGPSLKSQTRLVRFGLFLARSRTKQDGLGAEPEHPISTYCCGGDTARNVTLSATGDVPRVIEPAACRRAVKASAIASTLRRDQGAQDVRFPGLTSAVEGREVMIELPIGP